MAVAMAAAAAAAAAAAVISVSATVKRPQRRQGVTTGWMPVEALGWEMWRAGLQSHQRPRDERHSEGKVQRARTHATATPQVSSHAHRSETCTRPKIDTPKPSYNAQGSLGRTVCLRLCVCSQRPVTCGEVDCAAGGGEHGMRGQGLRQRLLKVLKPRGTGRRSTRYVDTNVAVRCSGRCQGRMWHQKFQRRHAAVCRYAWDTIDQEKSALHAGYRCRNELRLSQLEDRMSERNWVGGALPWKYVEMTSDCTSI